MTILIGVPIWIGVNTKKWVLLADLLVFLLHAFFDLFLHVGFGIIEFTDTFSESTHEFRNFAATEKNQNCEYDEDPL